MNVDISNKNLIKIPKKHKDKIIDGDFNCSYNKLTSLVNSPKRVSGNVYCAMNNLESLENAPKEVGGNFSCLRNKLISLEGAPEKISRNFYCNYNKLTSLKGALKEVGGSFSCSGNKLTLFELLKGILKMKIGGEIVSDFYSDFVNRFYRSKNNHKRMKMIFEVNSWK